MKKVSLVIALLLFAFGANADPILTDHLNFLGYPYGLNDGHYYVGNARGSLASNPNNLFTMWCIDSLHSVTQNSWDVDVLSFSDAVSHNSMGFTLADLQLMAVAGSRFINLNPFDSVQQHIIWSVGDHRTLTGFEPQERTIDLSLISGFDFSHVTIFDPREPGGQMMMTMDPVPNTVPEPGSMWLLATAGGFFAVAKLPNWLRRRRKQN